MSEMIDRVENAIAEAMGRDSAAYRGCYTKAARAAIEAMREPLSRQLAEVLSKPETHGKYSGQPIDDPYLWSSILTDLIDAALSEKP